MGEIHLEKVEKEKYLGVVLNKDLTRKDQVGRVTKKGITLLNFVFWQLNELVSIQIKNKHTRHSL